MPYARKKTKTIYVGGVPVGGGNPITVQSMTSTDTRDVAATVKQIHALEEAGCEIVRVAAPDMRAAEAIAEIKKQIHIPLAADVHFDYRIALKTLESGADKLRINPGNIGSRERVALVAEAAKKLGVPIRIGVNSGSPEKGLLKEGHTGATAEGLCESALRHVKILEELDFYNIIIAVKASSAPITIEACQMLAEKTDYPLHLGVTEAGTPFSGGIKSAAAIGALLAMGIGDTIRVSLTGSPVDEVLCAREILKALELRNFGVRLVSCPTCGRTRIDLIGLAEKIENATRHIKQGMKIAVMGCAVNGPGEAADADIGIAGGDGDALIYRNGRIIKKVEESALFGEVMHEVEQLING